MSAPRITSDELLAELERLARRPRSGGDTGSTRKELAAALGVGLEKASQLLRAAQAAGRVVVGLRRETDVAGRPCTVPVYRLVKPVRTSNPKGAR